MDTPVGRRHCIPIVYTRGTHYEVGFDVGRTFKGLIQDYVKVSCVLQECLPLYETEKGKKLYEDTFNCVQENFPQYIRELEGTADGAEVPFYKLFLLHMDDVISLAKSEPNCATTYGCTTVCCNEPQERILGHTEDALADFLGYFYFVSAHIISEKPQGRYGTTEEKFTSLCYAGHLPGFTMSYNHHGMVYSINVIHVRDIYVPKTPRFFLCRALLAAENFAQAEEILKDKGVGAAEGFSVNMTFLEATGDPLFYNIEIGSSFPGTKESLLHTSVIRPGEYSFHCNRYLRLKVPERGGKIIESSDARHKVFKEVGPPKTKRDVRKLLSHQSKDNFTIFRDYKYNDVNAKEPIATIAIGIFDCIEKTWSIYADNPSKSDPIAVLPIVTKLS